MDLAKLKFPTLVVDYEDRLDKLLNFLYMVTKTNLSSIKSTINAKDGLKFSLIAIYKALIKADLMRFILKDMFVELEKNATNLYREINKIDKGVIHRVHSISSIVDLIVQRHSLSGQIDREQQLLKEVGAVDVQVRIGMILCCFLILIVTILGLISMFNNSRKRIPNYAPASYQPRRR